MKNVLWLIVSLFPSIALAGYDAAAIKSGLMEQKESFQINGWKPADDGNPSIADTSLDGYVLTVGEKSAGFMALLQNSEHATHALIRCLILGSIGLSPSDEVQRGKIGELIKSATRDQVSKSLEMNGVKFEVSPQELGGNVYLSCILSPAS